MPSSQSNAVLKRVVIFLVVIAALVLAVFGIRRATHEDTLVKTAHLSTGDVTSAVSTNGKVEPVQLFQAHAAGPGQVEAVYVTAGQTVQAGTLLVRMDAADANSRVQTALASVATSNASVADVAQGGSQEERIGLANDIAKAELQAREAKKSLDALTQLQARGAASAAEVSSARDRSLSADATLAGLRQRQTSRYAATDRQRVAAQAADSRAALAAAQQQLSNNVIRTPITGTVFSLPVRAYDFVQSGEELVQLADLSRMQVRAYFDEPEIGKLRANDSVRITWDARPGRVWHGHIVRVPTTVITYGTRNVGECLVAVDDATGDLLPNTDVTVNVTTQEVRGVQVLPREALRTLGSANFVYVIRRGELHKTQVQIGATNLKVVQISGGLQPDDEVALSATNGADLQDGMQVKELK